MTEQMSLSERLRNTLDTSHGDLERLCQEAADEIDKLRDVLTWSEQNCPGRCAGVIRKAMTAQLRTSNEPRL